MNPKTKTVLTHSAIIGAGALTGFAVNKYANKGKSPILLPVLFVAGFYGLALWSDIATWNNLLSQKPV